MSNSRVEMFNEMAASPKSKPDKVIEALGLKEGQSIADIGSGGGYFSLRFAEIVGLKGKVFAVDVNQSFLDFIKKSAEGKGLKNLSIVLSEKNKLGLPEKLLDLIFIRNATHHISERAKYFRQLGNFLKSNGRIAVIEHKPRGLFSFHGLFGHSVKKKIIMQEMKQAGYSLEKEFDFLPEQHFTVYSRK
ncbi:MAG: methyltransferase domain-containing protein [Candidatus Diapherotrites archaeon]